VSAITEDRPDAPGAPTDESTSERRSGGSVGKALVVMAIVALVVGGIIIAVSNQSDSATTSPERVVVPADYSTDLASGDAEELVPEIIRLEPGQELVLENDDWRPHTLGDLTAERGKTAKQTFATEGRYITATSLRNDGRVTILVEASDS
jgi:hypothetical protein